MCVKIIGITEHEFDPKIPLESQIKDAKEIYVNYDSCDLKIESFLGQMEMMAKNGISCNAEIVVNPNSDLDGFRFERKINKIKKKINVNEIAKSLTILHADTDRKLNEISEICLGRVNEQ